jgi:16S rRNA (uracil1498-N3)-methyltransferase
MMQTIRLKAGDAAAPLSAAPRFYLSQQDPFVPGTTLTLPPAAAQHAVRALRLGEGDAIVVFDGSGGEYAATLAEVGKRDVLARVVEHRAIEREAALPIRLVQCLQGGDKMDYTIQKAVELGVSEIVPVISQRSVVRLDGERAAKRVAHWRQVVIAASEQCGRNRLAVVREIASLERWLAAPADGGLRLLLSPQAASSLASLARPAAVELLVGPEGGLATREAEAALGADFCAIRLGPRVLRTETAGLAALSAIHACWGDFL